MEQEELFANFSLNELIFDNVFFGLYEEEYYVGVDGDSWELINIVLD